MCNKKVGPLVLTLPLLFIEVGLGEKEANFDSVCHWTKAFLYFLP